MTLRQHETFHNLYTVEHPLVAHKLTILREKSTPKKTVKELIDEITFLLAYEVTKNLPLTTRQIETPLETMNSPILLGKKPVIVPILRAGIGMVDSFLKLMPGARVGHIGMFRDETTLQPETYYFKIPRNSEDRQYFVCDPMLATGGSALATLDQLKEHGISRIVFVCLFAAPEGAARIFDNHPDVHVYTATLDRQLNDNGYILPGLGDAGDRLFGTQ